VGSGGGAGGGAAALVAVAVRATMAAFWRRGDRHQQGSIKVTSADARGIFAQSVGGGGGDGRFRRRLAVGGRVARVLAGPSRSRTRGDQLVVRRIFAQVSAVVATAGRPAAGFSRRHRWEGGNAAPVTVSNHGNQATTGQNGNGISRRASAAAAAAAATASRWAPSSPSASGHGADGGTERRDRRRQHQNPNLIDPVTGTITAKDNARDPCPERRRRR
jgi:hypothetical protein